MPSLWEVVLLEADAAAIRPEWVHAVVSRWFDDEARGGHGAQAKPYALAPPTAAAAGASIIIGLLDDRLADRLLTRAA